MSFPTWHAELCKPCSANWMLWPGKSARSSATCMPSIELTQRAGGWRRYLGSACSGATAVAATVPDPTVFRSGREFAAWIGLGPRQNSRGGKERLGSISKQGDRNLRRPLVIGATTVLQHARRHPDKHPWLMQLLARRPAKV